MRGSLLTAARRAARGAPFCACFMLRCGAVGCVGAGRAHLLFVGHVSPDDPPGEYGGVDGAPLPGS